MNRFTSVNIVRLAAWLVAFILALLPFHAFFTVWLSSLVGHYTILRLWKEFLLVFVLIGTLYVFATDKQLRHKLWKSWLNRLIGIYALLLLLWAFVPLALHNVTGKAMWYGLLVDLRFLVFFLAVWVIASNTLWLKDSWQRLLLVPAILVAAFAILQYLVLPYDFLKHFGYGDSTISPYETINHNINHLRVASTLRGANPLGAYLLLPISAMAVLLIKDRRERADKAIITIGLLMALAFSFSRSAWLGAGLSLLIITWVLLKKPGSKKYLLVGLGGLVIAVAALAIIFRHNSGFESIFYHTDHTSTISESSNEGHSAAFKAAADNIIHEPFGRGVGTAGPQSTYNYGHLGRISENYFMQIGQEAGLLGMSLFIIICIFAGKSLWDRRNDTLALWLFASLVGISFINLLSHAWTDDALAYLWWGIAGAALAFPTRSDKDKQ